MKTVEVCLKEWILICAQLAAMKDFIEAAKEVQANKEKDEWDKGREIGRMLRTLDVTNSSLGELIARSLGEAEETDSTAQG